jgi:hypothetical protein
MGKDAVLVKFKVLSDHFPGKDKGKHENQLKLLVIDERLEPDL